MGGPRAYVGHLTFQKIFWSKSPPWGPKTGSNKIKYPHLREVISLKFIVVVVYILQIIDINCQAFFFYILNSFDALCNPRKIINKSSISREKIKYNCLNLTGTTRAVYHVELYKSSISSHTIRYFLNLIRKRMYHVENTNLAFQVIQSDIIFSI